MIQQGNLSIYPNNWNKNTVHAHNQRHLSSARSNKDIYIYIYKESLTYIKYTYYKREYIVCSLR